MEENAGLLVLAQSCKRGIAIKFLYPSSQIPG